MSHQIKPSITTRPQQPTISVIMPVFNAGPYLKQSIQSILHQTYKDFELIIVDDHSTDKSAEIIKKFIKLDSRVVFLQNTKNLRMAATLNKAIEISRGKYIARQDADDISLPKRLEVELNFLKKNPRYAMCGVFPIEINTHNQVLRQIYLPVNWKIIQDLSPRRCCFVHGSVLIKKSVIKKLGGYSTDLNSKCGIEDFELWHRITQNYQTDNIPRFLYKLRKNPTGLTFTNLHRQQHEHHKVVKLNLKQYQAKNRPQAVVSVIVPTHNRPSFLSQALLSIINQSYKYLEVIVVDDGSGSASKKIINHFQHLDPRIVYIRQSHQGVIAARNNGLKRCHGEYIAMLDDDDLWYAQKIEQQLRLFTSSKIPNLGLVYCFHDWVDESGKYLRSNRIEINEHVFLHLMSGNIVCGSCSSVLIKSGVFDTTGYFDSKLDTGEDWQLWLRISALFGIDFVPKYLAALRETPGRRSEKPWMVQHDRFLILKTALILIIKYPHLRNWIAIFRLIRIFISNFFIMIFIYGKLHKYINYIEIFLFDPKRFVITLYWNIKGFFKIEHKALFPIFKTRKPKTRIKR